MVYLLLLSFLYATLLYLLSDITWLTKKGWVLYHSETCGHCVTQIKDIGWKMYWVNSVKCNSSTQTCAEKGIRVFPTWLNTNTNQIHEGKIRMAELVDTLEAAPSIAQV
jgi:hypothetical protein